MNKKIPKITVITLTLGMFLFILVPSSGASLRRVHRPPLGWVSLDLGYLSSPDLGSYRTYLNNYYFQQGSTDRLSNFGGGVGMNFEYKSFFTPHFGYGFFFSFGSFSTDQVFNYYDDYSNPYQSYEEYNLKSARIGMDLSFSPINTRRSRVVPYFSAGGMISSGTLEFLYTEVGQGARYDMSYRESTFNFGYRFEAGLVIPVGRRFAFKAVSRYSSSELNFDASFDSNRNIDIESNQWFVGGGLVYFYKL